MNIEQVLSPSPELVAELSNLFHAFTISRLPDLPPESEDKIFMVTARSESGVLQGGILANCYWDGLEIETLWVDSQQRGQGLGSILLENAEAFGIRHGAVISFLKTMEAKAFYESCGYEVYGVLEDRPIGTLLYHMKKRLIKAVST
ncbi:GNAT family N-acetyltransferase [Reinekea blandensis]|uniref:Acetyltransferase, GNAT family protein n=1 Tax=Reinekea blandensis MED297 TaxID=314283 RepID=A4BDL4_9GAMM|nr:GNAT family N-acetyltransferase [Reinekea blandensis]EAR09958.1 acetyltransferase, GNAT family protein [Reinekea sp. MED297] [Reinekea blandensis MED297]